MSLSVFDALTTRGFDEVRPNEVGDLVVCAVNDFDDAVIEDVSGRARALCERFPLYE
ncbi:MAG: hypothetical protein ABEI27_06425 [Halobellus sp.]|uniref:hypothetical protein n=1 Tax=Halobellus sp. TaxID=1979212 RepID=UPI0035D3F68A